MLLTAIVKSSVRDLFRMKHLLLIVLLLGLVSCSKEAPKPARPTNANAGGMHKYYPTIALVKIHDGFLQQHGVSYDETNGFNFGSVENRAQVAGYILAHPGEFSFTTLSGNFIPVVWNNRQTHISLLPDPQQEERDLNTYGLMTTGFDAGVDVGDEDSKGTVRCTWTYGYGVHMKEPIGGSTDHGVDAVYGGGYYPVGKPDMAHLFQIKGTTVWMVVALNRK